MYKALYLSPMIPSFNLAATTAFFTGLLGFDIVLESETYIILSHDNLTVHLLRAGENIGQMEFYLEVEDVDNLWESIKDKMEGIKIREPFVQEYGMKEIHIGVPFTNTLMFVGQWVGERK